jgi:hypothetical protein
MAFFWIEATCPLGSMISLIITAFENSVIYSAIGHPSPERAKQVIFTAESKHRSMKLCRLFRNQPLM